jgi:hypothetical protein
MGSTLNLNSTTVETAQISVHTTIYSDQTFSLNSNEYKYFEISTTELWEMGVHIGHFESKTGFIPADKFTGYSIFINTYASASHFWIMVYNNGSPNQNSSPTINTPSTLNSSSRIGIAVSPEKLKLYMNNSEIGSYDYYYDPVMTGSSIVSKSLNTGASGDNHVTGGITSFYFDPALWKTNSAGYTAPLGNQASYVPHILKNLKQY